MYLKLILALCCFTQVFSVPVSTPSACTPSCQWTQWFNVDHPTDQPDGGDWETLHNIRAHGYNICRAPIAINCRSVRFPYVPYSELLYKTQCDPSTGLICRNKGNVDTCIDFEVQLLCCTCEDNPPQTMTTVSTPSACTPSCQWTQWFNVDHPTDQPDGGDWETLHNIRAHGYNICRAPIAINCRSVRFPYVPYSELLYKTQCDPSTGLICRNKGNVDTCIDFEVQLLCCTCEDNPPQTMTTVSTPSACTPSCQWTQWFNVDHPTDQPDGGDWETLHNIRAHGYNICRAPIAINCRSVRFPYVPYSELLYKTQCDPSTGLICRNKGNVDTCIDFEVQLLCCTCEDNPPQTMTTDIPITATQCANPRCSWTKWFNTHSPTPGLDGGEFENITTIRNQGYSVCDVPQAIQCRLQRFPYVPLKELYSVQECSVSSGLVCLNKKQPDKQCLDFEVQFLCCVCDASTPPQVFTVPSNQTLVTTNSTETTITVSAGQQGSGMLPNVF